MMPSSSASSSSPSSYISNINMPSPPAASDASTPRAGHRTPSAAATTESRRAAEAAGQTNISAAATKDTISTSANISADPAVTAGNAAILNVAGQVTAGATKIVGWTFDNMNILDTSTSKSGLRPMYVRVSIRVHHVAFLHPGLDIGGRTKLNGGRFGKWKFTTKKNKVTPPGLLRFGSKKGDWTNPNYHPHIPSLGGSSHGTDDSWGVSGKNLSALNVWKADEIEDVRKDTTEIAEIISAEAFRLSRDGIIQHHFALNHAFPQSSDQPPSLQAIHPTSVASRSRLLSGKSHHHIPVSNTQDEARYYKECAERPKGYRRLVVSSACNAGELAVPSHPNLSSHGVVANKAESSSSIMLRNSTPNLEKSAASDSMGVEKDEKDLSKEEKKDETMFDNVEYQYVGPPKTGPEFFNLLRHHGAATFGRHLPELSCIVPNHSIGFEVRQSNSKKKRAAATQPFVVEAPHVIWGDARDKMLSRIAKEGCPMIDSRKFEYVSNERLHEAEYTESLMVTGSTIWVQNVHGVDDEGDTTSVSSFSTWGSTNSKRILKAKYYGGKLVDGMKEGAVMGAKGTKKTHKETRKVAEKGTKHVADRAREVIDGAKELGKEVAAKLPSIPDNRELTTPLTSHLLSKDGITKKSKLGALKDIIRRRNKGNGYESLGEGSISIDNSVANQHIANEHMGSRSSLRVSLKKSASELFIRPVHYELLTDDIIEIRIVSFPNKDDIIASFPISVASVMAQRSVGDRVNDPLQPSELTETLVQEPSAPLLRWGVELKVTLRAVEVKPRLSKMMPHPMPVIADKIASMRDNRVLNGMATDEIVKDLQATEDQLIKENSLGMEKQLVKEDFKATEEQLIKEENELNDAIVAYGYKIGENDVGEAPKEIRLRQMFYCEREHGAIARKMERKSLLSDDERDMMKDARADPSIVKKDNRDNEHLERLEKLCKTLPGIDNVDVLDAAFTAARNSLERSSLAIAISLDICFGEVMEKSAKCALQSRLRQFSRVKCRPPVTKSEARAWCSQVADKLSSCAISANIDEVTIDLLIAKIQSIIVDSVHESRTEFKENESEEMKLDEDEMALSETRRTGNLSLLLDPSELVEWVTVVASLLVECAEELDVDQEVSILAEQESNQPDQVAPSKSPNPAPTEQMSCNSSDEFSLKAQPNFTPYIDSGEKTQSSTPIATLQNALPRSSTKVKSSGIANKYHSQQAQLQTSSLVTTLAYLTLLFAAFLCIFGAVILFLTNYCPGLTTMYNALEYFTRV